MQGAAVIQLVHIKAAGQVERTVEAVGIHPQIEHDPANIVFILDFFGVAQLHVDAPFAAGIAAFTRTNAENKSFFLCRIGLGSACAAG